MPRTFKESEMEWIERAEEFVDLADVVDRKDLYNRLAKEFKVGRQPTTKQVDILGDSLGLPQQFAVQQTELKVFRYKWGNITFEIDPKTKRIIRRFKT